MGGCVWEGVSGRVCMGGCVWEGVPLPPSQFGIHLSGSAGTRTYPAQKTQREHSNNTITQGW